MIEQNVVDWEGGGALWYHQMTANVFRIENEKSSLDKCGHLHDMQDKCPSHFSHASQQRQT